MAHTLINKHRWDERLTLQTRNTQYTILYHISVWFTQLRSFTDGLFLLICVHDVGVNSQISREDIRPRNLSFPVVRQK